MKKKILLLALGMTSLVNALEFYINSGREEGNNFAVLNIKDEKPFLCKEIYNRYSEVEEVICEFDAGLLSRFEESETLFFTIKPQIIDKKLNLLIKPKKKIKLFNQEFDLAKDGFIPKERNKMSRKWQILGYGDTLPFINENKLQEGINFPLNFRVTSKPSIGILDYRLRPMNNDVGLDKDYFLRIQSFVQRGAYDEALLSIDEMLELYPETIFKRDVLYYKIHSLDGRENEEDYEDIIELAKAWLAAYPTDIHASEILQIMAKTYAKMNFFEEAKYYYSRLFEEYKDDKFSLLAKLDYAENLYKRGERNSVPTLYNEVLNKTNDLDVASKAALLLAEFYRKEKNAKEAQSNLNTILEANPTFFLRDIQKTYNLLKQWEESGIYAVPAKVAELALLNSSDQAPFYKNLLKDVGLWYDKAGNLKKAHEYYARFLEEFGKEEEAKEIKTLDDKLLLAYDEGNATKKLEHYDYVIEQYKNQEEAKMALEKKAQTLYELKEYEKVFDLRGELPNDNVALINSSAMLIKEALRNKECKKVAYFGETIYKNSPLTPEENLEFFDCLMEVSQYKNAQKLALLESKNKDPKLKAKWLYRLGSAEYALQDYQKAAFASRDALAFSDADPLAAFILFNSLSHLNRTEEAMELLERLEKDLGNRKEIIEVYSRVLEIMNKKKDDIAIQIYANKLLKAQAQHQRYEYSPWAEFSLIESYIKETKFKEALQVANEAQKHTNSQGEMAQVLYLKGYLSHKIGERENALKSYQECAKIQAQTPWKNLCTDALNLMENQE
ncbi:tetratricopeptide repeat protein [Helicobacter burdigaliensis]|uniref:tetratricopeptide repeat protein n=1 Tax=Helicobacter burdigaliensis TaxID=2315334 RepID=UPI001E37796C|nr:flagellar functional protein [Helicobacter burdigaliensis]